MYIIFFNFFFNYLLTKRFLGALEATDRKVQHTMLVVPPVRTRVRPFLCVTLITATTQLERVTLYTIIGGSCHKHYFCGDKSFVTTTTCCRKYHFCRDKSFVTTNTCCHKYHFCRDKHVFVATKLLSRQKWYLWQLPPVILHVVSLKPSFVPRRRQSEFQWAGLA